MAERVALTVNDERVEADADSSVAAAVMHSHGPAFRQSVTGEARGPLCGMGVCFECRLTVNGVPHQRTCLTPCRDGLRVSTKSDVLEADGMAHGASAPIQEADILILGAGPAGLAAAIHAQQAGRQVTIVDDNPHPGGQIWRHDPAKPAPAWIGSLQQSSAIRLTRTQILASVGPSSLLAETPNGPLILRYQRLILATGARERFLPFPGWTLPGVFGAGGLQALVKSGYSVRGLKVIVAGSGPLLLAVAAHLRAHGADLRLVAEQTPRGNLLRFAGTLLWHQPTKLLQGAALRWQLRGVPFHAGAWPVRADGGDRLRSVTLTDGRRTWSEPCDALACGFGLVPNLELPLLLGCALERGFVKVDGHQQTSIPHVYAVGELTGIGGLDKALCEGEIAGWAAADQPDRARSLQRRRASMDRFVALLDRRFALREELRHLADDATIVCRCEDVRFGALKSFANWRDAKLQTRCGMGPCQGRLCGPAVEFLFGWTNTAVRPPIFPTALGNLA